MAQIMKALRDFRGRDGEGTNLAADRRFVEAGCEFRVGDDPRANWLEQKGHAIPVSAIKYDPPVARPAVIQNGGPEIDPLDQAGGGTGPEIDVSSSPEVQARKPRIVNRRAVSAKRSRSTKAGG